MADAAVSIAAPDEFAQHARWRAFRDPAVEANYREWHLSQVLPMTRILVIGSIALWGVVPFGIRAAVGDVPRAVYIGNWAIAIPALLAVLIVSYTRLRRLAVETLTLLIIVLGLDIIWFMGSIYSPASGPVVCGTLALVFYPLVIRLPTGATAVVAATLTTIPVFLQVSGMRHGDILALDGWPYISALVASAPMIVVAAALIEASMRQQFAAQSQLQASRQLLRRYAPAAVADRIVSGNAKAVGHPKRLRVTALSSDVAGFTALADQIDPESLSQIINEYMATMSEVVEGQGGVVTEFAGDGLMAIFGAPEQLEPEDQVRRALAAANAMHARLAELNKAWFQFGIEQPLRVRIGINTGMLSVGTFGSDGRATYTAIGLQMNVAARLQAQCEPGGILLSSASWHLVNDTVECDPLGEVTVKGVHFPISIYAPRTHADQGPA
jgi:class 3 adenylate cyclase